MNDRLFWSEEHTDAFKWLLDVKNPKAKVAYLKEINMVYYKMKYRLYYQGVLKDVDELNWYDIYVLLHVCCHILYCCMLLTSYILICKYIISIIQMMQ